MTARSSSTLPPIKFDPTITIDIRKERKALDEKIWEEIEKAKINKKGPSEEERERILFRAAKLRSILNDFPEEIQELTIGSKVQPGD